MIIASITKCESDPPAGKNHLKNAAASIDCFFARVD